MKLLLIFLLHLIILLIGAVSPATAQFEMWVTECGDAAYNFTANPTYKSNRDALLTNITKLDIKYGFYNFSKGEGTDQFQAIALCRGDVNVKVCHSCLEFLIANLTASCKVENGAVGWADKCMLRYDSSTVLDGRWVDKPLKTLYTEVDVGGNVTHFASVVKELLMSLPTSAAAGDYRKKFAYGEVTVEGKRKVYATMQCTPELKPSDCLGCLYLGLYYIFIREDQTGAKILQPSCSIRYELNKFYHGSPSGSGKKPVNLRRVIVILAGVLASILFVLGAFLIWFLPTQMAANKNKKKLNHYKSLEMDPTIIRDATRNFARACELGRGRGGIAIIYKGKLHGKEIAVKRIKGTRYLSNDELLVAKLQHTNLVELLGVCLYRKEKCLVFEYVSRGRLGEILFDPKRQELDWEKRYVIIRGIAQGLLYLHKECRDIIVHCDLNASNVFLDKNWTPKITDFRTAMVISRKKKEDQKPHPVAQKVGQAGGYMAPEYFNGDEISEKSDVYSFGVLVLEILAGRRRSVVHEQEDLITMARRTLSHGTVLGIADPRIKPISDSAGLQMKGCVKIALECLHEDAKERADMRSVDEMLTNLNKPSPAEYTQESSPQPQALLRNRFPSSPSPEISQ